MMKEFLEGFIELINTGLYTDEQIRRLLEIRLSVESSLEEFQEILNSVLDDGAAK